MNAAKDLNKDYPHKKSEITKQVLTTKLKAIRIKFRDSGRKSGHGRVVFLYFDLCEHIWGCSPSTEQILSGVESIDIDQEMATSSTDTYIQLFQEMKMSSRYKERILHQLLHSRGENY